MKKSRIIVTILIAVVMLFTFSGYASAVTFDCSKPDKVKNGEEFSITLKFDKKISAITGQIKYDEDALELTSSTGVTKVSDGNAKIAVADMDAKESEYKINFKAENVTEGKSLKFNIIELAVATADYEQGEFTKEVIISNGNTSGYTEITSSSSGASTSAAQTSHAKTGENEIIAVVLVAMAVFGFYFTLKYNRINKMFIVVPLFVFGTFMGNQSLAVEKKVEVGYMDATLETSVNTIGISPNAGFLATDETNTNNKVYLSDLEIFTASEIAEDGFDLLGRNGEFKEKNSPLATGDRIIFAKDGKLNNLQVIVYGDSNGDGKICNALDIDVIIKDYINGETNPCMYSAFDRVAADLYADEGEEKRATLNAFDIGRMIAKFKDTTNDRQALGASLVTNASDVLASKDTKLAVEWSIYADEEMVPTDIFVNEVDGIRLPSSNTLIAEANKNVTWEVEGTCLERTNNTERVEFRAIGQGQATLKAKSGDTVLNQYVVYVGQDDNIALEGHDCILIANGDEQIINAVKYEGKNTTDIEGVKCVVIQGIAVRTENNKIIAVREGYSRIDVYIPAQTGTIHKVLNVNVIEPDVVEYAYASSDKTESLKFEDIGIKKLQFDAETELTLPDEASEYLKSKKLDENTYLLNFYNSKAEFGETGIDISIVATNKTTSKKITIETNLKYDKFVMVYKPIIYLYPEEETDLTVTLGKKENLTCTYPKYEDGWDVKAYPDGTLIDNKSGNKLYALYWEGASYTDTNTSEGFVVKGEDSAKFLEEKLEILGLNYKEKEEFIVYWLPILEANKYNFIRFATQEEINEDMPLNFSVQPDSVIRVLMRFKALDHYEEVEEQKLETPKRDGFVAVEWGGSMFN